MAEDRGPCPFRHNYIVEGEPGKTFVILSGSPVGERAWQEDGLVLCGTWKEDAKDMAMFLATPEVVQKGIDAMNARRRDQGLGGDGSTRMPRG